MTKRLQIQTPIGLPAQLVHAPPTHALRIDFNQLPSRNHWDCILGVCSCAFFTSFSFSLNAPFTTNLIIRCFILLKNSEGGSAYVLELSPVIPRNNHGEPDEQKLPLQLYAKALTR